MALNKNISVRNERSVYSVDVRFARPERGSNRSQSKLVPTQDRLPLMLLYLYLFSSPSDNLCDPD